MIQKDRKNREMVVECDGCGDQTDAYDMGDFHYMIEDVKEQGWTVTPDGTGRWKHYCRSCNPDDTAEDRIAAQRALLGFN